MPEDDASAGDRDRSIDLDDQEREIILNVLENALSRASPEEQDELLGLIDKIPRSGDTITQDSVRRRFGDV